MIQTDMASVKVTKQQNNRQAFADLLRVLATCAVVLLHTITGVMDTTDMSVYPLEKTVFLVCMDLITWCVPIFVMISGYLFLNPCRKLTIYEMFGKYCRRILLALFCFGIPYAILELVAEEQNFRISMFLQSVKKVCLGQSWSHLWYLYLIFLLYFLTPFFRKVLPKVPKGMLHLGLIFLLLGSSLFPFLNKLFQLSLPVLPDGGIYLFYYVIGYLLACQKKTITKRAEICLTGLLLIVVAGMVISRLVGNYHVQMAYNYPFTVLLSIILVILVKNHEMDFGSNERRRLRSMDALSFTVYLVHPVFLNLLYKFLHKTPLDFFIGVSLPFYFCVVLLSAVVLAWILRKLPLLNRYVL